MTQAPNPLDPVEEAQIAQMVNEGGRDKPSSELDNTVQKALDSLERLNRGEPAPYVVVETDGEHTSARWVDPKKKP